VRLLALSSPSFAAGTGFTGWHGGIADSFRASSDYSFITGGQFISHPHNFTDYRVEVVAEHPIVEGITHFDVHTEQYYLHVDPTVDVLATTTFSGEHAFWKKGVEMPVVYKSAYGHGRVFYSALGHKPAELDKPEIKTILTRGLLWAAR